MRIWDGYIQELQKSAEAHCVPFSLLKEVALVCWSIFISYTELIKPMLFFLFFSL